jgi:hypothetical protein
MCFTENGQQVYQNQEYNTCFCTSVINIKNPGSELKVYPNPGSGEWFVQPSKLVDEGFTLEMYSVKGELVRSECVEGGNNPYLLNVSSLKNGIYLLRMISGSGKFANEVIIKE